MHMCARALAILVWLSAATTAHAAGSAETAIRDALSRWIATFNDGQVGKVCALFARELRQDSRGFPERGYDDICALLRRSLADTSRRSYALRIKEILVSGDLAIVRLVWTLKITGRDAPVMDVFRRQSDGSLEKLV